jgi:hypothetical protein
LHAVDALYVRPITALADAGDRRRLMRYLTILQMYRYFDGIFWLLSRPGIEELLGATRARELTTAYAQIAPRPTLLQRTGRVTHALRRMRRGASYVLETKAGQDGFDPPRVAWSRAYWPDS